MKRREFITLLGGAAVAWPRVARAQQPNRMRRIAILMQSDENDPGGKAGLSGFTQALAELGWTAGRNVRMDVRWAAGNADRARMFAKELADLQPDVILAHGTPATAAFQRETRTIPIVFVFVGDPVGEGFVAGLPRPGGNITGFIPQEASMAGKWVGLLTEIAPGVKRAAIMFNPDTAAGGGSYFRPAFEAAARSLKVAPIVAPVHSDAEIETVIASLGREPGGGLVVRPDSFMVVHRSPIICWRPKTTCRQSIRCLPLPETAVCFLTDPTCQTSFAARRPMSIAFSVAPSRRSSRFNCRPNL
jgi:putative ABC transport system substrate-binding protein